VTNTSVNFARSFGVAIVHGGWAIGQLWLFAAAHVIAIALAVTVFKLTHCDKA
jgi:aquaporin Z